MHLKNVGVGLCVLVSTRGHIQSNAQNKINKLYGQLLALHHYDIIQPTWRVQGNHWGWWQCGRPSASAPSLLTHCPPKRWWTSHLDSHRRFLWKGCQLLIFCQHCKLFFGAGINISYVLIFNVQNLMSFPHESEEASERIPTADTRSGSRFAPTPRSSLPHTWVGRSPFNAHRK